MTDVLFVCTANRCRSPMAEAILRRRMAERGVAGQVSSAGFLAGGYPAMDEAIAAMAGDGYDLSGHVSREVTTALLDETDLVVAMTRDQLIDLVMLAPNQWPRMYQIRDLVQRVESAGPPVPGQPFDDWLVSVGSGRTRSGLLSGRLADDIADPVGGPVSGYHKTRVTLDDLVTRLATVFS